jgi:hypothetical protein
MAPSAISYISQAVVECNLTAAKLHVHYNGPVCLQGVWSRIGRVCYSPAMLAIAAG